MSSSRDKCSSSQTIGDHPSTERKSRSTLISARSRLSGEFLTPMDAVGSYNIWEYSMKYGEMRATGIKWKVEGTSTYGRCRPLPRQGVVSMGIILLWISSCGINLISPIYLVLQAVANITRLGVQRTVQLCVSEKPGARIRDRQALAYLFLMDTRSDNHIIRSAYHKSFVQERQATMIDISKLLIILVISVPF